LKTDSVFAEVTHAGRLFQRRGAATPKARSPAVDSRDLPITVAKSHFIYGPLQTARFLRHELPIWFLTKILIHERHSHIVYYRVQTKTERSELLQSQRRVS